MNFLKKLFASFKSFFISEIEKISRLDGHEGLSVEDIVVLVNVAKQAQVTFDSWEQKKDMLERFIRQLKGADGKFKVPSGAVTIIGYLIVQLAKRKGLL